MCSINNQIEARLFELQDPAYRNFHSKLIPTVSPDNIIGVRTPVLRKYAKELAKNPEIGDFLTDLPHKYYDENNVHACIIEQIKDYESCLAAVEAFLPYIDNWATCDMLAPRVFGTHREELLTPIRRWLVSGHTYTIRFGIGMLMRFYLGENFAPEYPEMVAAIHSEEYYVNMMIAWYFATALAKNPDAILPYLENRRLNVWTHNKTIQKACESYRIRPALKEYLRTLKIFL
jgi:3-methyladenine DNA glycosylase AlkD